MRILMLGNSYIFKNDLPAMLAEMTGAEVVHHTRGGARLAEQLNPKTALGAKTLAALEREKWDYVVLQEMSNAPITSPEKFQNSVHALCEKIRAAGAEPVLYATWAYQKGGKQLASFGMDYEEMYRRMADAYREAAERSHARLAEVGKAFYERSADTHLYAEDGSHPNETGTRLAAEVIAQTILRE
jgi:hypothetical protein